jgi:hypothetical protein
MLERTPNGSYLVASEALLPRVEDARSKALPAKNIIHVATIKGAV